MTAHDLYALGPPTALVLVAVALVGVSGANDGGVLLAMGIRYSTIPLGVLIAIVFAALVITPMVITLAVARTLATRLVPAAGGHRDLVFVVGIAVALAVVLGLGRLGVPTSITLAIIGGLAGAGAGAGLVVGWLAVGTVLIIGALAPVVGVVIGFGLERLARLARVLDSRKTLRRVHWAAFVLQCGAYAANDGQKMLAVAAIAAGALPGSVALLTPGHGWTRFAVLVVSGLIFCVGMVWRLRPVSLRIGFSLAQVRPLDAVVSELAASGAVVASSALGAPVSMTQALTGGLVGASSSQGMRRVRWNAAGRIAAAWLVTLPASALIALAVAAAVAAIG